MISDLSFVFVAPRGDPRDLDSVCNMILTPSPGHYSNVTFCDHSKFFGIIYLMLSDLMNCKIC